MRERVPSEKVNAVYLEKQKEVLTERLAGHELFGNWRGEIEWGALRFLIEHCIGDAENLSQVKSKSTKFFADMSVLMRILAKLKLEKNELAFSEMQAALCHEGYRMFGEDIPFEQTIPITVVIFKPEIMLTVIQWMMRDDHLLELDMFIDPDRFDKDFHQYYKAKESTAHLKELLPSLASGLHRGRNFWNCDLYAAIFKDVLAPFLTKINLGGHKTLYPSNLRACKVGSPTSEESVSCGNSAVAYVFQMEQSEFLKQFSRDEQRQFATWQLFISRATWFGGCYNVSVGIHPESENALWQKLLPQYASKGVNGGIGLVAFPDDRYTDHMLKRIAEDPNQLEMRGVLCR